MMMLDDFFTLSERNHGLTVPSRVKELVDVMKKESDSVVDDVGEVTRQWSVVAAAIAATENRECISLFVHLDGLDFIEKWLKDAVKLGNSSADSCFEDAIVQLLQAVDKLQMENEKVVADDVWNVIKELVDNSSFKVKEKAQLVVGSWGHRKTVDASSSVVSHDSNDRNALQIAGGSGDMPSDEVDKSITLETAVKEVHDEEKSREQISMNADEVKPSNSESVRDSDKIISLPHADRSLCIVKPPHGSADNSTELHDTCTDANAVTDIPSTSNVKNSLIPEPSSVGLKVSELAPSSQNFQVGELEARNSSPSVMEKRVQHPLLRKSENSKKTKHKDRAKSKTSEENIVTDKIHDIDIYGIVDPLELARQVAIEVQREVVESRNQSCSSSEKHSGSDEKSSNSESRKSNTSLGSLKGPSNTDLSDESSVMQEESSSSMDNPEVVDANEAHNMDNSLVSEVSQEANTEKPLCIFDLNQELSSEDVDGRDGHLLLPVSSSEAAAVIVGNLQFDGSLGWKGSAATSAFHPAYEKSPENDKGTSSDRSMILLKQKEECLEIDLNAGEITEGKAGDLSLDNKILNSWNVPCSGETTQARPERFDLDLNCLSEDSSGPSDLRLGKRGSSYGFSYVKQPSLMSFDLNDQPAFLGDISNHSSLNKSTQAFFGGMKSDEPVISIMGTRVKVNQKDSVPPSPSAPVLQASGLSLDINMGRGGNLYGTGSVLPYNRFPSYSYQNIAPGPAMPFNSAIYTPGGPIPYMVDSRGAPVAPQIITPASTLPAGFPQIPFFMNMAPGQGPSNGLPTQGSVVEGGGSRDPPGFTQFLNLGQVRPTDEHLRSNSLPFSAFITGKRKEPENGWEPYPFKHQTPPWK